MEGKFPGFRPFVLPTLFTRGAGNLTRAGPTMVAVAVGSSSWGLVRCIKFAVYGAVAGQIVLILIRKYRFVFTRKLLKKMLIYCVQSIIMI